MRRAAKIDLSQQSIVTALRAAGLPVWDTHALGGGFPDAVTLHARTRAPVLLEVKTGSRPCDRKLTPMEQAFSALFPVAIVSTPEEALAAVGIEVAK